MTTTPIPPFDPNLDIDGNGNTNAVRADRAAAVVEVFREAAGFSNQDAGTDPALIQDLICDLLHYMHRHEMEEVEESEFFELVRNARRCFIEESTHEEKVTAKP